MIGLDKAKEIINNNLLLALRRPDLFDKYHKRRGANAVFYGCTGTGKTALARAIGGEAGINVILVKIDEIIDMYTGNTEKNLHECFENARKNKPCILFFDEVDALGIKRSGLGKEGTAQVMRQAVEQFLVEMNSAVSNNENIFIIGATNNPWDMDAALLRSGRFDVQIYIPLPNLKDRKKMFKYYLLDKPFKHINFGRLARATIGYSGADIQRICGEATIRAIKNEHRSGNTQILSTATILSVLRDKDLGRDTTSQWFARIEKEQFSSKKTIKQGDKKQTIEEQGSFSDEERLLYKDLINDIKKRKKNKAINNIIRWMSVYVL